jgi:hypothetical protein
MLQVCVHDLKKLYRKIPKDSLGGWKTQFPHVDWRNLHKGLKGHPEKTLFPVEDIAAMTSLPDALWSLGAVRGYRRAMRLFACRCARETLPPLEVRSPERVSQLREVLDTGERYARNEATGEDLTEARNLVWSLLNPDKHVRTDEDGNTAYAAGSDFEGMFMREKDLGLRSALLATAAALREDVSGGVWRAVHFVGGNAGMDAWDALKANADVRQAALKVVAGPLAKSVRDAIESLAGQVLKALAGKVSATPTLEELCKGALASVRHAVDGSGKDREYGKPDAAKLFVKNVEEAVEEATDEVFAEFQRLCRLEKEYGELGEE